MTNHAVTRSVSIVLVLASLVSWSAPAYDRGGQALAAGNGEASPSRSHALRQSGVEAKEQQDKLRAALLSAAGTEAKVQMLTIPAAVKAVLDSFAAEVTLPLNDPEKRGPYSVQELRSNTAARLMFTKRLEKLAGEMKHDPKSAFITEFQTEKPGPLTGKEVSRLEISDWLQFESSEKPLLLPVALTWRAGRSLAFARLSNLIIKLEADPKAERADRQTGRLVIWGFNRERPEEAVWLTVAKEDVEKPIRSDRVRIGVSASPDLLSYRAEVWDAIVNDVREAGGFLSKGGREILLKQRRKSRSAEADRVREKREKGWLVLTREVEEQMVFIDAHEDDPTLWQVVASVQPSEINNFSQWVRLLIQPQDDVRADRDWLALEKAKNLGVKLDFPPALADPSDPTAASAEQGASPADAQRVLDVLEPKIRNAKRSKEKSARDWAREAEEAHKRLEDDLPLLKTATRDSPRDQEIRQRVAAFFKRANELLGRAPKAGAEETQEIRLARVRYDSARLVLQGAEAAEAGEEVLGRFRAELESAAGHLRMLGVAPEKLLRLDDLKIGWRVVSPTGQPYFVYQTGPRAATLLPVILGEGGGISLEGGVEISSDGQLKGWRPAPAAGVEQTAYEGKEWNRLLDKIREAGVQNFSSARILIIGSKRERDPSYRWSSAHARFDLPAFISTTLNLSNSAWGPLVGRDKAQLTLKLSGPGQERHAFIQVEISRLSDDVPGDDVEERPASRRWPHGEENAGVEEDPRSRLMTVKEILALVAQEREAADTTRGKMYLYVYGELLEDLSGLKQEIERNAGTGSGVQVAVYVGHEHEPEKLTRVFVGRHRSYLATSSLPPLFDKDKKQLVYFKDSSEAAAFLADHAKVIRMGNQTIDLLDIEAQVKEDTLRYAAEKVTPNAPDAQYPVAVVIGGEVWLGYVNNPRLQDIAQTGMSAATAAELIEQRGIADWYAGGQKVSAMYGAEPNPGWTPRQWIQRIAVQPFGDTEVKLAFGSEGDVQVLDPSDADPKDSVPVSVKMTVAPNTIQQPPKGAVKPVRILNADGAVIVEGIPSGADARNAIERAIYRAIEQWPVTVTIQGNTVYIGRNPSGLQVIHRVVALDDQRGAGAFTQIKDAQVRWVHIDHFGTVDLNGSNAPSAKSFMSRLVKNGQVELTILGNEAWVGRPAAAGVEQVEPKEAKILVVEDDETVRNVNLKTVRKAVSRYGIGEDQVFAFASAAEAAEWARANHPTLTLTDYNLLNGTGLDVLAAVREKDPSAPVILYSGVEPEDPAIPGRFTAFIPKPGKPADLDKLVTMHLVPHLKPAQPFAAVHVALSIGGTKIAVGVLTKDGLLGSMDNQPKSLYWKDLRTQPAPETPLQRSVKGIAGQVTGALRHAGVGAGRLAEVGISWAGPGDYEAGQVENEKLTEDGLGPQSGVNLKLELERELERVFGRKIPVRIMHDGAAGALGEHNLANGALYGKPNGMAVILGTGIGAGIIQGGRPVYAVEGKTSAFLGEVGWHLVTRDGVDYEYRGTGARPGVPLPDKPKAGEWSVEQELAGPWLAARFVARVRAFDYADEAVFGQKIEVTDDLLRQLGDTPKPVVISGDQQTAVLRKITELAIGSEDGRLQDLARDFIRETGTKFGNALRAFRDAYADQPFVRGPIVLISTLAENLGVGVINTVGADLFLEAVRAAVGTNEIFRSRMGYEREFAFTVPPAAGAEQEAQRILEALQSTGPVAAFSQLFPKLVEEANEQGVSQRVPEALLAVFHSLKTDQERRHLTGSLGRAMMQGLHELGDDFEPDPYPRVLPGRGTIWTVTTSPTIDVDAKKKLANWSDQKGVLVDPGGGGINVAIGLAWRGVLTRPVFFYAGETGKLLIQLIRNRGVVVHLEDAIELKGDEQTRVTIVTSLDKAGSLVPKGTPVNEEARRQMVDRLLDPEQGVKSGDIVVMSGSLAPGLPEDFYADLGRKLIARGATVMVDTKGAPARAVLFSQPAAATIYSQNQLEFGELVGINPADRGSLIAKAGEFLKSQPPEQAIREIVITRGSEGADSVTREKILRVPAPKVEPVSELAAGDTSLAERVFRAWQGKGHDAGFVYGVAAGSASVMHPGTGGGLQAEVDHFAEQLGLKEETTVSPPEETAAGAEQAVLAKLNRLYYMANEVLALYSKRVPRATPRELYEFLQVFPFLESYRKLKYGKASALDFENTVPNIYWPDSKPQKSDPEDRSFNEDLALRIAAAPVLLRELIGWISLGGIDSGHIETNSLLTGGDVELDIATYLFQDYKLPRVDISRLMEKKELLLRLIGSIKELVGLPAAGTEEDQARVERVVASGKLGVLQQENGRRFAVVEVSASQEPMAMELLVQAGLEAPRGIPQTVMTRTYPANLEDALRMLANNPPLNGAVFLLNNEVVSRQAVPDWVPAGDYRPVLADPRISGRDLGQVLLQIVALADWARKNGQVFEINSISFIQTQQGTFAIIQAA